MSRTNHGRPPLFRLLGHLGVLAIAIVSLGVATAHTSSVTPASACTCGSLESQIDQAAAVFTGRARDISVEVDGPAGHEALWNVEVENSFVGPDAPVLAVSTGGELSNCLIDFEPGDRYGIVAFWRSGHLATSRCGVATPSALEATMAGSDGSAAYSSVVPVASAVVLASLAALVLHRRRRLRS